MGEPVATTILYACSSKQYRSNEHFVAEHTLGYMITGEMKFFLHDKTISCEQGSIGLLRKNQLVKALKIPPVNGEYKSINIFLTQEILMAYAKENNIKADASIKVSAVELPTDNIFLKGYFQSLMPYCLANEPLSHALSVLKTKEAIELILKIKPDIKNILFDFSEPHKIDLEAFMSRNFSYNASLANFAKLTGRSLAAFKRDFEKIFHTSPGVWLLQRRLQEAYYLIAEKKKKPSDIYLDVGFENLSHFSHAFKKLYGVAPSLIA